MREDRKLNVEDEITYGFSLRSSNLGIYAICKCSVSGVPISEATKKLGEYDPEFVGFPRGDLDDVITDEVRAELREISLDSARFKMIELVHVFNLIVGV